MEKLSHTSHRVKRQNFEKPYDSFIAAATDRKIRNIISTRKSGGFLDTTYSYVPKEKLQFSDSAEVTHQLSTLKSLMDQERFSYTRGDIRLARLRSEGSKIHHVVELRKNVLDKLRLQVSMMNENIVYVIELQATEEDNQTINLHVLDRMRTTLVYLKRRYKKFEYMLHDRSFELSIVSTKSVKTKEQKNAVGLAFHTFKDSVIAETESKQKELEKLEKDLKKRKEMSEKKLQNKLKQAELMEKAMIEDQSAELEELREKYLLHFMWYMASSLRFEKEQVKWKRLEDAFFKIKIATGVQDIPLLVEKYLTKEQIYMEFLNSVKKKEVELVDYREKIEKMQISMEKLNESEPDDEEKPDKQKRNELQAIRKLVLEENGKMKHLMMVKNKINDWCGRFLYKLQKVSEVPRTEFQSNNIKVSMEKINSQISRVISRIKENKANSNAEYLEIQRKNIKDIIQQIPVLKLKRKKASDALDLSELVHIETQNEDHAKKHK